VAAGGFATLRTGVPRQVAYAIVFAAIAVTVLGTVSLAPWIAYRSARYVLNRTASPTLTLAASRIVAEPRPVARAAAAVGGIALVAGGAGTTATPALQQTDDPFYLVSYLLVAAVLLVALVMVVGTLAVHAAESLLDRKRSIAALAALGTSVREMERAQFAEIALAALPVAAAGALLGTIALGGLGFVTPLSAAVQLLTLALTLGLVWLAIELAVRATRPWVRRATSVENLRTA